MRQEKGGLSMETIGIIIAFLFSLSFILLLWEVKGRLLRSSFQNKGAGVSFVLTAGAQTRALEQRLKTLLWLRDDTMPLARLVVLDEGMSAENKRIAERFRLYEPTLLILTAQEAAAAFTRRETDGANE